jgi:muconolactone delta-isomerase
VDFLVQITTTLPPDMPPAERDRLTASERRRGLELVDMGVIRGIWRVPGALRNVAIWQADDATHLHELIMSLPASPWFSAEVTALAEHPLGRPDVSMGSKSAAASDSAKHGR